MTLYRTVLAIVLAIYGLAAQAQALPKPKEFYFDEDVNARPVVVVKGEGETLTQQLVKARERGRKTVEATAQLAHIAMSGDRAQLGKSLYQQALQSVESTSGLARSVRWNYAWDLFRNGETEPALTLWAELARGYGSPSWVPPTLALALWSAGRESDAVQWYAAAVRTEPNLWNNPANFPKLLPSWRDQDRARLAEVHAAWAAKPPSWP